MLQFACGFGAWRSVVTLAFCGHKAVTAGQSLVTWQFKLYW